MWLAGTARPRTEELAAIKNSFRPEKYVRRPLFRARNRGGGPGVVNDVMRDISSCAAKGF